MTFIRHSQISVLVAVAILEEYCMTSVDMQWMFYSGELILFAVVVFVVVGFAVVVVAAAVVISVLLLLCLFVCFFVMLLHVTAV